MKRYTPKDIRARLPQLSKWDLIMWVRQGYLEPVKVSHGRVERNEFTEEEFEKIRLMVQYTAAGLPPRGAYKRAMEELQAQKPLVLHGPRLPSLGTRRQVVMDNVLGIQRAILENSPTLLIAVSASACLVLGAALADYPVELSKVAVIPIEKERRASLLLVLRSLGPEDRAVIVHDGSQPIMRVINEAKESGGLSQRIKDVDVHAI